MIRARNHLYNEFDPYAAQWLRNLISAGELPAGVVDERSIADLQPDDVAGWRQCHFFAGIGGWPLALRLAGWPEDLPIWTGSCPCQPFSNAGQGAGVNDPRHLWPDFFRLIRAARPPVVMGEQVAGSAGYGWLDGVRADLAGEGYASRGVDIPACAVDAPHIRSRLYWVAVADRLGDQQRALAGESTGGDRLRDAGPGAGSHGGGYVADALRAGPATHGRDAGEVGSLQVAERRPEDDAAVPGRGDAAAIRGVADADRELRGIGDEQPAGQQPVDQPDAGAGVRAGPGDDARVARCGTLADPYSAGSGRRTVEPARDIGDRRAAGRNEGDGGVARNYAPTFWAEADWIVCHDGKQRRTQPGLPLLVNGVRGRVAVGDALGKAGPHLGSDAHLINRQGAWKGAGNAIVPQEAEQVIRAFMDVAP
jgi:DNA (cytosine-5)-methyltransferase 1